MKPAILMSRVCGDCASEGQPGLIVEGAEGRRYVQHGDDRGFTLEVRTAKRLGSGWKCVGYTYDEGKAALFAAAAPPFNGPLDNLDDELPGGVTPPKK